MTPSPDTPDPTFRCSAGSREDGEELAGTAPTEADWLFVEYAGPWGAKAVASSRLPDEVRAHLAARSERVHLIRRPGREGRATGAPLRVFAARLGDHGDRPRVTTAVVDDHRDLLDLSPSDFTAYDDRLWMVCTNGSRDVCCAERGRPVVAALAERWPEATWETTHLGGHRFSATLIALPSGIVLGRLDAGSTVKACEEVAAGAVPGLLTRGHVGRPGVVQFTELHLRAAFGYRDVHTISTTQRPTGASVSVQADEDTWIVEVEVAAGEPRRVSCADLTLKPAPGYRVLSARRLDG